MTAAAAPMAAPRARSEEPEWLVWATVLVALVIGALIQLAVTARTVTVTAEGVALSYPAAWFPRSEENTLLAAGDIQSPVGSRVSVRRVEAPSADGEDPLIKAATAWSVSRGRGLTGYQALGTRSTTAAGKAAYEVEYVWLEQTPQGAIAGSIPVLMRGVDTLVVSGPNLYVLSFAVTADDYAARSPRFPHPVSLFDRIVSSWRVP